MYILVENMGIYFVFVEDIWKVGVVSVVVSPLSLSVRVRCMYVLKGWKRILSLSLVNSKLLLHFHGV